MGPAEAIKVRSGAGCAAGILAGTLKGIETTCGDGCGETDKD